MHYVVDAIREMRPVSLRIEAADAVEARRQAGAMGCAVVGVRAARTPRASRRGDGRTFPLLHFNQSLLILLKAGLSVVEAIEALRERETGADAQAILGLLHADMRNGRSFSAALAAQPGVFPPLYVASVRANEQIGALAEAIERFIAYRAQADLLRKRVIGAAIYPAMILFVGGLVIAFLVLYVVPRFSVVFQELGDRIPLMSRLLLQWGRFAHDHGLQLLLAGAVATGFVAWAVSRPAVRAALLRRAQRLPRVGEHLRAYQLARVYRALGMLQQAGIPIVPALAMVGDLLPSSLRPALEAVRRDVAEGRALSDALAAHGLATAVSLRLLRAAERSGRMGEMLERTAGFHEEDVAQAIDWFIRLFEPLLMIAIGIVIGIVVLLMYAPIFELAGSLQ
jgi:general secretion pathway protein F